MNRKFITRLNMFDCTDDVLTFYAAEWAGYAPMENRVEIFREMRDAINTAKISQQKDIKGNATIKEEKRGAMADIAITICGRVKGWCDDMGDTVGYQEMHITRSMIMHGKSSDAQGLCTSIFDKANTMTAAEKTSYKITAGNLTSLQNCIADYALVKVSPRTAIAMRKSDTDSFKKMFTDCTLVLKKGIDNLMEYFAGSQFYKDYFNARRIVEDATQKATLTVTVVSEYDGTPLAGVLVACTDGVTNFEEMTDSQGRIKRTDIHPDVWDLTCTKSNFTTGTAQTDIYPGDKDKVLVKLKPV